MHAGRRYVLCAAAILAAVVAAVAATPRPDARLDFAEAERSRLRAHFDTVERELLTRDVSALDASQRAARVSRILELRRYRDRGLFPRNHEVPGRRNPIFVDRYGTHCAVGHLIATSGRADIVTRVRTTRNTAAIHELAGDTALLAWLDVNGLTLDEAARIQPGYDWEPAPPPPPPEDPQATLSTAETWASVGAVGVGLTGLLLNAEARASTARALFGFGAGAFAIGVGAPHFDERGTSQTVGVTNAVIGAASIGMATYALVKRHRASRPVVQRSLSVEPMVVAGRMAPGVLFRARF
jgi:hypothetical protein